jgi:hypothetical protein
MLIARPGRTLAAKPRSTIHTSPRCGSGTLGFFPVQRWKDLVGRVDERVVR